ncbi:IS630 family transposase [Amylibacter sp.]|nr:IS630 family transposase [Amylibacter sp.]
MTTFPNRLSEKEKLSVIDLVGSSKTSVKASLERIGISRASYYRWIRQLREEGTLQTCVRAPDYCRITEREDVKKIVFQVMHAPPSDFGFNRTTWKLNELQEAIEKSGMRVGRHSIRRIVRKAGYRWLKARKVLTSSDPEYRQKLSNIQRILGALGEKEGFFSIDEYGPFAVKQRQGRKLVPPGEQFTVPQFQKSKGALIMTAALELSTNQVTHFYSKKKNTEEMIKLLDLLRVQYSHLDRIFLSWDAASWHISKKLLENIEHENTCIQTLRGPTVALAPLPAGAQFLNVIEAVFSGMSRAIIHNSNYASKDEAKAAIDRYFSERNEYFQKHPKRAGNKIWGEEPSVSGFSESNNCKDPRYR